MEEQKPIIRNKKQIKRFDCLAIGELIVGDRFYMVSDKTKTPHTVKDKKGYITYYGQPGVRSDRKTCFDYYKQVIFLRENV